MEKINSEEERGPLGNVGRRRTEEMVGVKVIEEVVLIGLDGVLTVLDGM